VGLDGRYRRAQLALQKGDEELAKEALKRRKSFQENADSLMAQFSSQREATDKLMSNTKLLESKLGEAKAKKVAYPPPPPPIPTHHTLHSPAGYLTIALAPLPQAVNGNTVRSERKLDHCLTL
jgi:hypothetical protein